MLRLDKNFTIHLPNNMASPSIIMNRLAILAMSLGLAASALANPSSRADSTLRFDLDFARFSVNETTAQVEVYIAVPCAVLRFAHAENQWRADFACQVVINKNGVEAVNHQWQVHSLARDSAEIKPGQLLFTPARGSVNSLPNSICR